MTAAVRQYPDRTDLTGKVAVVTGAARGMGAEHVKILAARGATVLAVDRDDDGPSGHSVLRCTADVSSSEDWERIRVQATDLGAVKILINNAGVVSHRRIAQTDRAGWDRVLDVNLKGVFLGMQMLAPAMREVGGGSIVNVSSAAGLDHHPDVAYTASKWGVRGLTKTASQEFGRWGVRVNSIHPGYIDTPMNDFASPELRQAMVSLLPLGRPGEAWEAAELAAFLASDAAAFITGAEIAIDGGWTSGAQATAARRMS
ncbi:SDR family NAD(P)-dependent oxidoreductase [Aeromicrobium sp. P5_D10]